MAVATIDESEQAVCRAAFGKDPPTRATHPLPAARSREPSRTASHELSRTASHEPSRTASHEPSRTASHEPSRTASHEPSRTASQEPGRTARPEQPQADFGRLDYRHLVMSIPDGMVICDAHTRRILAVNPAWLKLYGYSRDEARTMRLGGTRAERDATAAQRSAALATPGAAPMRRWHQRRDGSAFPVDVTLCAFEIEGRACLGCVVRDATERCKSERMLAGSVAHFKALAQLAADWYWELDQELRFSAVASSRLPWLAPDLFRGRTFAQLPGLVGVSAQALQALDGLMHGQKAFRDFYYGLKAGDGQTHYLRCSGMPVHYPHGGFAGYRGTGQVVMVHRAADIVLVQSRKSPLGSAQRELPNSTPAGADRQHLERDLRDAVASRQLQLHYQPRLRVHSGILSGMEALLRWSHPRRGTVAPAEFIPLAETTGLIQPLGDWALEVACRQAKAWEQQFGKRLQLAVNLSPRQVNRSLPDTVRRVLAATGLAPQCLELEITESALLADRAEAMKVMRDIAQLRVNLALDGFGTGYASLTHLKSFPLAALNLDRSFVAGVADREEDRVIARSVIAMAHGLGLRVVAAGVETEAQRQVLREMDCDEYQGYLNSPAVSAKDFAARQLHAAA